MTNQLLTEAAEKISGIFGGDAFSEQTFKVRDILADLSPSFESERKQLKEDLHSVISDLEDAVSGL